MIRNQCKILIPGSILILAVVSGCVSTTGVEAPDSVYPDSSFQAVVTVEVNKGGNEYGHFGVLVPNGWDANNVTYSGPFSGDMFFNTSVSSMLENVLPSAPWDHWIGFETDVSLYGEAGDCYEVTVSVYTDDIIGTVDIAFLGMVNGESYTWPCSTTVEVIELNLDQTTWGSVKSRFGNI